MAIYYEFVQFVSALLDSILDKVNGKVILNQVEALLEQPQTTELQIVTEQETISKPVSAIKSVTKQRKLPPHLFKKGQSGNPSGRPKGFAELRQGVLEYYSRNPKGCVKRLFKERIDLFFAYGFGKPADRVELSGPDGGAIEVQNTTAMNLAIELQKRGLLVPGMDAIEMKKEEK